MPDAMTTNPANAVMKDSESQKMLMAKSTIKAISSAAKLPTLRTR